MFRGSKQRPVEVLSERSRIPADGASGARICVRFNEAQSGPVTFKLNGRGSFDPNTEVRECTCPVVAGEVNLTVYAPNRPGSSYLVGPGIKYRIEFAPATHMQGIVFDWAPTLGIAIALALLLRSYAVASYYIPSGSMESTLTKGDLLIAQKFDYRLLGNDPRRGDIVIFVFPGKTDNGKKQDYIKRCIGLPGDTVEVRDGVVFVNGIALEEEYEKEPPVSDFGPITVPPDNYFMMGDNRNHSSDSRMWGFVPKRNLQGRALFVFWPPQHAKPLPNGLEGQALAEPNSAATPSGS